MAALERSDNVVDCGLAFAGLKRGYLLTMATKVTAASRRCWGSEQRRDASATLAAIVRR